MTKEEEKRQKEETPEAATGPKASAGLSSTANSAGQANSADQADAESSPHRDNQEADTSERHDEGVVSVEELRNSEACQPPLSSSPEEPNWKTLYAVTLADFDNYKKRAARDREDIYRYAESDILKDVLPALDNLELALAADKSSDADTAGAPSPAASAHISFVRGVRLVYDTLLKSLKDHGAEPFDSVGKDLDTEKMEAIATLPHAEIPEGKVAIESKRGWMLKGKVLRAAQVVVSSGKPT